MQESDDALSFCAIAQHQNTPFGQSDIGDPEKQHANEQHAAQCKQRAPGHDTATDVGVGHQIEHHADQHQRQAVGDEQSMHRGAEGLAMRLIQTQRRHAQHHHQGENARLDVGQ